MNQVSFDLFWSMRSPYCYLALDRLLEIRERFDVEIKVRVVYPLAIRQPDFFKVRASKHYRSYNLLDTQRWSKYLKVPFRRPVPDPIVQELSTGVVADQQPYIYRLTRVTELATQAGKGMEFLNHVVRLLWDGSTDNWHEGDHLSRAINRAGLDGKTYWIEPKRIVIELMLQLQRMKLLKRRQAIAELLLWCLKENLFSVKIGSNF